jgi:hypothetical protein
MKTILLILKYHVHSPFLSQPDETTRITAYDPLNNKNTGK